MTEPPSSFSDFTLTPELVASDDRFTDLQELPSGGFNMLVRARRAGKWWMLKALKPQFRGDSAYERLLRKELDITSCLSHPGIVSAQKLESVDGLGSCIVMEWVDGTTLKQWMEAEHSRSEREDVLFQLMDVLEYVHNRQTVHRDLKPSNIMVTRNGARVKLIDFGLADTDSYAELKLSAGTEGYMAPEQRAGNTTDQRNDIFSLGRIMEQLDLSWRFRRVARQCQRAIARRPKDIAGVRGRLTLLRRLQMSVLALLLLAAAGGAGYGAYRAFFAPEQHYDVLARFIVGDFLYESWGDGKVTAKCKNKKIACAEIPPKLIYEGVSYCVEEIVFDAFKGCSRAQTIVLPRTDELHIMRGAFTGATALRTLVLRSSQPPIVGNDLWPCEMGDVFTPQQFESVRLMVPKGSREAYANSPWREFKHIEEV